MGCAAQRAPSGARAGQWRVEPGYVGHDRRSGRRGLRGGVHRQRSRQQWPGSRVISAQKANTANAFSLPGLSLSTANLYTAVQPGGSLFGLQESNPVETDVAYSGNPGNFGQKNDPMVGGRIGGVNVFGGGLALYNATGKIVGALGVSGDTSCADHNIAWRTRSTLNLDYVPAGVRRRRRAATTSSSTSRRRADRCQVRARADGAIRRAPPRPRRLRRRFRRRSRFRTSPDVGRVRHRSHAGPSVLPA